MANTKSAKKRVRSQARETTVNSMRISKVRTVTKAALKSIETGSKDEALKALKNAESEMMRAASRGAMKKKTAARKVSRMAKKINKKS
jgi:small subunit ribosomal protein S20